MEHTKNDHKNLATIFVDADAFVASVKADDRNHTRAHLLFEKLTAYPVCFLTSNYVFSETVTVLSQKVSRAVAITYIDTMTAPDSPFLIRRVVVALEEVAIAIFKQQTSKNTSFVDCTNMAFLSEQSGFHPDAIFSFDEVYKKNGFLSVEDFVATVPPEKPEDGQEAA